MNTATIKRENFINLYNERGEEHGYWEWYYPNGQLDYKGDYVNGNRHGYWEVYHSNGDLEFNGYYDMGKQVDYNPNAQVELTLPEIAAQFGIPVERLRIKK